jgi:hypothetical protein
VALGELPACIEACPKELQRIGPRQAILKRAHQLAGEIDGFIYGENESGGTNTIYVSPVPFDILDQAIATGPGRPHLKSVPDSMTRVNRFASALIAGPVIGAIAAVARRKRSVDQSDGQEG